MPKRTASQRKTTTPRATEPQDAQGGGPAPRRPLVFISHDTRDADLAEAFGNLLRGASGGMLAFFRSSDRKGTTGMEYGEEWYKGVMSRLGDATDVVALLTELSMNRPWILYEAGVAKGKNEATTVFGLVIGLPIEKASTGPFYQFQNCGGDEDSITKLVLQLIRRNRDADPDEAAVRRQVAAFRQEIDGILGSRRKPEPAVTEPPIAENAIPKLLEEVKVMLRDLPDELRDRRRRLHPRMLEEVLHVATRPGTRLGRSTGWLMMVSTIRDEYPWLYETGLDVYRALQKGDFEQAVDGVQRMARMAELTLDGPWGEYLVGDPEVLVFMRHLPEIFEHYFRRPPVHARKPQPRRVVRRALPKE